MTSLERILGAARRQTVDRIPVAPYLGNHGVIVARSDAIVQNTAA